MESEGQAHLVDGDVEARRNLLLATIVLDVQASQLLGPEGEWTRHRTGPGRNVEAGKGGQNTAGVSTEPACDDHAGLALVDVQLLEQLGGERLASGQLAAPPGPERDTCLAQGLTHPPRGVAGLLSYLGQREALLDVEASEQGRREGPLPGETRLRSTGAADVMAAQLVLHVVGRHLQAVGDLGDLEPLGDVETPKSATVQAGWALPWASGDPAPVQMSPDLVSRPAQRPSDLSDAPPLLEVEPAKKRTGCCVIERRPGPASSRSPRYASPEQPLAHRCRRAVVDGGDLGQRLLLFDVQPAQGDSVEVGEAGGNRPRCSQSDACPT